MYNFIYNFIIFYFGGSGSIIDCHGQTIQPLVCDGSIIARQLPTTLSYYYVCSLRVRHAAPEGTEGAVDFDIVLSNRRDLDATQIYTQRTRG